jgi:hypothetical protein
MANFTTVRDLRNDALWVAGEAQTSSSSYYARSLEYLNAVLIGLLAGGPLGTLDLPAIDWWWANQTKAGKIVIPNAVNSPSTVTSLTATIPNLSTTITFSAALSPSIAGFRFAFLDDQDQLLHVTAHTAATATATVDLAWQKATKAATAQWVAWDDQVPLADDFVRFTTPLKMGRYPYEIEITDVHVLEQRYPRSRLWLGTPICAAIVNQGLTTNSTPALHFSHMLQDGPIVAEYEYLFKQSELVDTVGTEEPPLPHSHRRCLSLGAAYLMLFDKVDAKASVAASMFQSAWNSMAEEHYRQTTDNENFGRILSRQREVSTRRFPLRSPSGFIYG